jgi:hypothetical protein
LAGGAQIIVESGGTLKFEGNGNFSPNCCSTTKLLTYQVNTGGKIVVDNNAILVLSSNNVYNVAGSIDILPNGNLCRQSGANFNMTGGSVLYKGNYLLVRQSFDLSNTNINSGKYNASESITMANTNITTNTNIEFEASTGASLAPNTQILPTSPYQVSILASNTSLSICTNVVSCPSNNREDLSNLDREVARSVSCSSVRQDEIISSEVPQSGIRAFPNPTSNTTDFNFDLFDDGVVRLTLMDIVGNSLNILADNFYVKGTYSIKFNTESLTPGIYLYTFESNNIKLTKRLIKL